MWAPNRIAFLTLPASLLIALLLQRARLRAAAGREEAARASDLNRLLLSLLAHDMRSPLSMAVQALEYVRSTKDSDRSADPTLLADVEQRLQRGLAAIDRTLALAPAESGTGAVGADQERTAHDLLAELEAEARSFEPEATARGKRLEVSFSGQKAGVFRTDPLLARQALAILVDNAVRYAVPGSVWVTGQLVEENLLVTVADDGPADAPARNGASGSGIGLTLCRALVARAGGDITSVGTERGTRIVLRLPLVPAAPTRGAGS